MAVSRAAVAAASIAAGPAIAGDLPANWQALLRERLAAEPDHAPQHWRLGGAAPALTSALRASFPSEIQPAAVLLPLLERDGEPYLLLTVRASHLRHHAGQISFPGGQFAAGETDARAVALRETQEEIGIAPAFIEALGFLPDHVVLTGFRITPMVGLLRPGFVLSVDRSEVAEIFELPLRALFDAANYQETRRTLRGIEVTLRDLNFGGHNIWGATAGILAALCELLAGAA
ncbi:MAG TPA: CoA pyrophosphatase [Steroidobacteraceae bacterium]